MLTTEEKKTISEYTIMIADELSDRKFLNRSFSKVQETISSYDKLLYFLECMGRLNICYGLSRPEDSIKFYYPKNKEYVIQEI